MKLVKNIAIALTAAVGLAGASFAAGAAKHPMQLEWSFEGPFGQFDMQSAQRGWQVYKQVCSNCHSLKYFHFRNLADLGYEEDMIKLGPLNTLLSTVSTMRVTRKSVRACRRTFSRHRSRTLRLLRHPTVARFRQTFR